MDEKAYLERNKGIGMEKRDCDICRQVDDGYVVKYIDYMQNKGVDMQNGILILIIVLIIDMS